jgi:hypothetical protein
MRVHCECGSHLFYLHTPPVHSRSLEIYLICSNCQKIWQVRGIVKKKNLLLDKENKLIKKQVKAVPGEP